MTGAPFVKGSETSEAAATSVERELGRLQADVLRFIEERAGATCDEVERGLNLRHQTASARVYELRERGLIEDSGAKRKTSSGRAAVVWRIRKREPLQLSLVTR